MEYVFFHLFINKKSTLPEIESEKLEWMKPIDTQSVKPKTSTKSIASIRFDFDGRAIPEDKGNVPPNPLPFVLIDKDIPLHTALYHHGEEPDKPGYTLNEV